MPRWESVSDSDPADFIRNLNAELGLPANLSEMGVQTDAIPNSGSPCSQGCLYVYQKGLLDAKLEPLEYEELFEKALA